MHAYRHAQCSCRVCGSHVSVEVSRRRQPCVACAGDGDLRLTGGAAAASGALYGRLEVFWGGGWGTVCGQDEAGIRGFFGRATRILFTEASADVACQQLGFAEGAVTATPVRMPPYAHSCRSRVACTPAFCRSMDPSETGTACTPTSAASQTCLKQPRPSLRPRDTYIALRWCLHAP